LSDALCSDAPVVIGACLCAEQMLSRASAALSGRLHSGVIFAIAVLAWSATAWFLAERQTFDRIARLIEQEQGEVTAQAASVGANIGMTLAHMRSIPKVLAKEREIEALLARIGPAVTASTLPLLPFRESLLNNPEFLRVAQRLESVRTDLGVDQIWVMNAAGDCVASGGFPPESTATGVNYADRDYFKGARRDGLGRQFAVGRTTNTPGIFYSAAVVADNTFVGAVAVKIDVARLSRMISDNNTFITDENGVIISAGDASMVMKVFPGGFVGRLSAAELDGRYKRRVFETLEIAPVDLDGLSLVRLGGRGTPMVQASSSSQADILAIRMFKEVPGLAGLERDGRWRFFLLMLVGISAISSVAAGLVHLRRSREHKLEMARANAELLKLNEVLLVQARFDPLTGCANRRYFFEELDSELKRAARFELPCCLAILDIDHFKSVNDRYGHAAGDDLLAQFSRTVGACLRTSDLLGRIGGEEFALLMPQTPIVGALEVAERIRCAVEGVLVVSGEIKVHCTVSIGIAQWGGDGDAVAALVARGDNAMYAAKRAGRNRVCADPGDGLDGQSSLFPPQCLLP